MPREIGMALVKIVSGGQTGVDRAALDAAGDGALRIAVLRMDRYPRSIQCRCWRCLATWMWQRTESGR
jgi:hypothetical protein